MFKNLSHIITTLIIHCHYIIIAYYYHAFIRFLSLHCFYNTIEDNNEPALPYYNIIFPHIISSLLCYYAIITNER